MVTKDKIGEVISDEEARVVNTSGFRNLAARVILSAVKGYRRGSKEDEEWLKSEALDYWCGLINISPEAIRRKAFSNERIYGKYYD